MSMNELLRIVRAFDGVLEVAPREGSTFPEISWGDHFFYYAPDGQLPQREQPFATVVTKNYPGDTSCDLDHPGRWRVNIHAGRSTFVELTGEDPRSEGLPRDYTVRDTVLPHPVYRAQGWISVTDPGDGTHAVVVRLLREAYENAKRRAERLKAVRPASGEV
jgi:hypothetical protein